MGDVTAVGARGKLYILLVLGTSILAGLVPPRAVAHHPTATLKGHIAEDSVVHTPAMEDRLERRTEKATEADAKQAAAAVTGNEGVVGQWGPVVDWPVVGVHVALLANGKVLAYDSVGDNSTETYPTHNFTRATVWDPETGFQSSAMLTGFNIFCSGLAHLLDGTLFAAGGNKNSALEGIRQTYTFNSGSNTWTRGADMAFERWYPSVTPLRDGEMLITEGGPNTPEVRETNGTLRSLTSASLGLPLYPWLDVAPDGRAFYSGPDQTMRGLNPSGTGSWQTFGQRDTVNRDYGSRAMFDTGKILVAGGGASTRSARVIDLNGATPTSTATAQMETGRRQHNLTVLADGTVLATGGLSSGASLVDLNAGVYTAELWNPATEQWRTLASMQVTRQYHSTALLLPDGRVLSAGGGICGDCDASGYLAKNAEVFTPPYLFRNDGSGQLAPRPQITSAPGTVAYNAPFSITTPDAGSIAKVALVRLGAVTHSVNMEQRYVPLSFTVDGGSITATAPANSNVAPPGVYMLFVIGSDGVPSVAEMVQVEQTAPAPPAPTLTDTDPDSPANDNNPEVKGSGAEAGSTVRIYGDASCSGPVLGSGSAAAFNGATGITATVPADQTTNLRATATDAAGNASACSSQLPYTEDSSPPSAPSLTDTDPDSPANDNNPEVKGSAEAGSTVRIYSTSDCSGSPLASGTAAQLSSPGITTPVAGDQTTNLRATATDAVGNTSGCSSALPYTEDSSGPEGCPCSIWAPTVTPQIAAFPDSNAYELGIRFQSDVAGYITGIRFYKGNGNTGTHTGHLWSANGTQLASATFTIETATGWQEVMFDTPVAIAANTPYVASYWAPAGHYALDRPYFTSAINNSPLHALADTGGSPNGVYRYGNSGFPTDTYQSSNYWIDVVFTTDTPSDTTPPSSTTTFPASSGSYGAARWNAGCATPGFCGTASDAGSGVQEVELSIRRGTGDYWNGSAFSSASEVFVSAAGTASWSYDFPAASFPSDGQYTIRVRATDNAGNVESASTRSFSFNATDTTPPSSSIWAPTVTPQIAAFPDSNAYELGIRFQSDVAGYITGIRFYKGSGNTGTHTGHLWSANGTQLASATFTNESATGWQEVMFDTPVAIAANTPYVASYWAPAGHYALDRPYFTSAINNSPLHALADTGGSPNGVYRYGSSGFPTDTYQSSNYWIDVVFTTDTP